MKTKDLFHMDLEARKLEIMGSASGEVMFHHPVVEGRKAREHERARMGLNSLLK
jgi:hypothetical protein